MGYWQTLRSGFGTALTGLRLSWRHLWQARRRRNASFVDQADYFSQDTGRVTLYYPAETLAVPDHGRYQLHNEMDDCIVCDKCAKVCPVDCIDIEPIKATEEIGKASDGSPIRLYAAKFDIDMAKCCYCGLCTTVCPTECLTMTQAYDYPTLAIDELNFHFANLTPQQAQEKRQLYEQFVAEKEALKKQATATEPAPDAPKPKPAFKPAFGKKAPAASAEKPAAESPVPASEPAPPPASEPASPPAKQPGAFKPVFRKKENSENSPPPAAPEPSLPASEAPPLPDKKPAAFKPVFRKKTPPAK